MAIGAVARLSERVSPFQGWRLWGQWRFGRHIVGRMLSGQTQGGSDLASWGGSSVGRATAFLSRGSRVRVPAASPPPAQCHSDQSLPGCRLLPGPVPSGARSKRVDALRAHAATGRLPVIEPTVIQHHPTVDDHAANPIGAPGRIRIGAPVNDRLRIKHHNIRVSAGSDPALGFAFEELASPAAAPA